jgi:hypothetical protein
MSAANQRTVGQWTPEKVEATRREVLRRAAEDDTFRRRCLENAAAAIKEVSGLEPPASGPRIRFVERVEEAVILLPPLHGELADDDLALVTGGAGDRGFFDKVFGTNASRAQEAAEAGYEAEQLS